MHDPLLTINPVSGLLLLALKGNIVPFSDVGQFQIFLDKLNREVESIKEFIGRPQQDHITEDYAHDVIDSWERQLRGEKMEPLENELLNPEQVVSNRQAKPKNKNRGEKPMTQTNQQPQHKQNGSKSKSRVNKLKQYSIFSVPDGWDPDELSWVLPQIAITDYEGGEDAQDQGHFVINVAGEIHSDADAKIPVQPGYGPKETLLTVEYVADLIDMVLRFEHRKVVVHCAMGMERSVLCVVAYMQKYLGKTIDEAYDHIGSIRPIAADRRHWIGA
jgi:hypothetical protein